MSANIAILCRNIIKYTIISDNHIGIKIISGNLPVLNIKIFIDICTYILSLVFHIQQSYKGWLKTATD